MTTSPESGLRQKVKVIIHYKLKGRQRTAEVVALVDTGQTLPYNGIMSRVAYNSLNWNQTLGLWGQHKKVESCAREAWWAGRWT